MADTQAPSADTPTTLLDSQPGLEEGPETVEDADPDPSLVILATAPDGFARTMTGANFVPLNAQAGGSLAWRAARPEDHAPFVACPSVYAGPLKFKGSFNPPTEPYDIVIAVGTRVVSQREFQHWPAETLRKIAAFIRYFPRGDTSAGAIADTIRSNLERNRVKPGAGAMAPEMATGGAGVHARPAPAPKADDGTPALPRVGSKRVRFNEAESAGGAGDEAARYVRQAMAALTLLSQMDDPLARGFLATIAGVVDQLRKDAKTE